VAFTPDGRRLASGALDGTVRIWDLSAGKRTPVILRHPHWVYPVAFSPDGKILISCCTDGRQRLWDMAKDPPELRVELPADGCHAFAPTGRVLITGGPAGKVTAWEGTLPRQSGFVGLGRGKKLAEWQLPGTTAIAVAPDSRHVAVGRPDGPIHILRMPELASPDPKLKETGQVK
jgi:WD40 repeat protein